MLDILALNPLNSTDVIFFIVIAAIVVLAIGFYFLLPVINRKQYKEQRSNLKKREAAFQSNIRRTDGMQPIGTEETEEPRQSRAESEEQTVPEEFSGELPVDPTENLNEE